MFTLFSLPPARDFLRLPPRFGFALVIFAAAFAAAPAAYAQARQPAVITLENLSATYDAAPHAISANVAPEEGGPYAVRITYAGKTTAPTNAGSYAVKVTATSPTHAGTATGTLVIAKAPLSVAALDQTRLAGVANPALAVSYEGFLAGQTAAVLDRKPSVTTPAKTTSPSGIYDITVAGGSDNNYEITNRSPAALTVVPTYPGTYECFVYDFPEPEIPVGKLTLTIPTKGTKFTGSLVLASEAGALSLAGTFAATDDQLGIRGTALRARAAGAAYTVRFTLNQDGLVAELLFRESALGESFVFRAVGPAALLRTFTKTEPAPWAGAYTLALLDPAPTFGFGGPAGLGHASGTVAVNGNLPLSGRLADGTVWTTTVRSDDEGGYRLFVRPYGTRLESYLSGELRLRPHADPDRAGRYYIAANLSDSLYWTKAPRPGTTPDAAYPDGFGPLDLVVALDPWLPPAAAKRATGTLPATPAITLAQRLGLALDPLSEGAARVEYGTEFYGDRDADLPRQAVATPRNTITPLLAAPPANPLKWSLKVTTSNGRFSGGFTLTDVVPDGTDADPARTRVVTRPVKFYGVLRQPPIGEDITVGAGYLLLPALPGAFDSSTISAEFRLRRPSGE